MQDKIEILKGFLAEDPNDSFSRFALALELVKLEKFDEAIKAFRTIETNDEKYVATYYHLGKALESVRKKDEAVETYEKGIKIAEELKDHHSKAELQDALMNATMDF
ncbi:MAG: tetratricopeptide repeat protein [Calditrichaeota bacterium]|nr:MAG: tetratricopeptide repeat protein [Calditrichota bacterium]